MVILDAYSIFSNMHEDVYDCTVLSCVFTTNLSSHKAVKAFMVLQLIFRV